MRITRLELTDFRNYGRWSLEPHEALTVLVGANAAGKTNAIEAIQLVSTGSSFRNPAWADVVKWGAREALVTMSAAGEAPPVDVALKIGADGSRHWRVDGAVKRQTRSATRFVPVVSFTPDDLWLVKGPAEQRRAMLDTLGDTLSATYATLRRNYQRVVRQRNALLKDEAPAPQVHAWDDQLVALGARLHVNRRRLALRILTAAAPIYAHLASGEALDVCVQDRCGIGFDHPEDEIPVEQAEAALRSELKQREQDERARKVTLAGPHRDDFSFKVDGRDARAYASQGQHRTIALAWKWAEVSVVTDVLGRSPVLLLDDVMSELDSARRGALTDLVQRDIQTFITTTNTGYFDEDLLRAARVVEVGEDR